MISRSYLFYLLLIVNLLVMVVYFTLDFSLLQEKRVVVRWEEKSIAIPFLQQPSRIIPSRFCNEDSFLLVMVHSAPGNFEARKSIRNTWAKSDLEDIEVVIFFLLGTTNDVALQDEIFYESERNGDIIQEDFVDSYNNLTLKSLLMLKLTFQHCYHATRFLLKSNDDTFVNLYNLASNVRNMSKAKSRTLLLGHLICNLKPERRATKKWYIPYYLFPASTFPQFLSGGAYMMSVEVAKKLYEAALSTSLFHMEDIYITGICAKKAGIRPRHNYLFKKMKEITLEDECLVKDLAIIYDVSIKDMHKVWDVILTKDDLEEKCKKNPELFSCVKWFYNIVFKVTDTPYSYRKFCI